MKGILGSAKGNEKRENGSKKRMSRRREGVKEEGREGVRERERG